MSFDSNPLAAAAPTRASDGARAEVEAAMAALASAPRRHAEAIDAFYAAELASLRAELAAAKQESGGVSGAINSAVAKLSEAPVNWHQATLFFFTADAAEDLHSARRRAAIAAGWRTACLLLMIVLSMFLA